MMRVVFQVHFKNTSTPNVNIPSIAQGLQEGWENIVWANETKMELFR